MTPDQSKAAALLDKLNKKLQNSTGTLVTLTKDDAKTLIAILSLPSSRDDVLEAPAPRSRAINSLIACEADLIRIQDSGSDIGGYKLSAPKMRAVLEAIRALKSTPPAGVKQI